MIVIVKRQGDSCLELLVCRMSLVKEYLERHLEGIWRVIQEPGDCCGLEPDSLRWVALLTWDIVTFFEQHNLILIFLQANCKQS